MAAALVEYGSTLGGGFGTTSNFKKENIRVCVRVRPLLPQEGHREEVIYYPTFEEGPLQVSCLGIHKITVNQSG